MGVCVCLIMHSTVMHRARERRSFVYARIHTHTCTQTGASLFPYIQLCVYERDGVDACRFYVLRPHSKVVVVVFASPSPLICDLHALIFVNFSKTPPPLPEKVSK